MEIGGSRVEQKSPIELPASTAEVAIETPLGVIIVRLAAAAPITVANFLHYVDGGFYDGGRFHRTVRLDNQSNAHLKIDDAALGVARGGTGTLPNDAIAIEVIQGGINPARKHEQQAGIRLERTSETGLRHRDGTISMARTTVDSAISDFFICINDQPDLDFGGQRNVDGQGFAAFGQVTSGMDAVRTIHTSPSDGQSLSPIIPITRVRRTES